MAPDEHRGPRVRGKPLAPRGGGWRTWPRHYTVTQRGGGDRGIPSTALACCSRLREQARPHPAATHRRVGCRYPGRPPRLHPLPQRLPTLGPALQNRDRRHVEISCVDRPPVVLLRPVEHPGHTRGVGTARERSGRACRGARVPQDPCPRSGIPLRVDPTPSPVSIRRSMAPGHTAPGPRRHAHRQTIPPRACHPGATSTTPGACPPTPSRG